MNKEAYTMNESSTTKRSKTALPTVGILLVIVATVLIIIFFLIGQIVVSGDFPTPIATESITCESNSLAYPFFTYDNSSSGSTKINAIFQNDKLSSISLIYTLTYPDNSTAEKSRTENHAAMNISFQENQLPADALGATYSVNKNTFQLSLYVASNEFTSKSQKYFLLDNLNINNRKTIKTIYEQKGFKCLENN